MADIALELNIPANTLHQWIAQYRKFENETLASPDKVRQLEQQLKDQERENKQKEREIADLQEE